MNIGIVKWFGGIKKTGEVNNFGFLTMIKPKYGEDLYFNRNSVLTEEQHLFESGIYVQFDEIITDNQGRKEATNVKLIRDVGIVDWLRDGREYINYSNLPILRIKTSESFTPGDVVFFLKRNLINSKNEPELLQIICTLYKGKLTITKIGNGKSNTIEVRKLLTSPSHILRYCKFINNYFHLLEADFQEKLLNELISRIKEGSDSLRSQYWDNINFLKQDLQYKGYLWDYAPENIKRSLIQKRYQEFANSALSLPENESINFLLEKLESIDDQYKPQAMRILFQKVEKLFLISYKLCQLLISTYDFSMYCNFLNKYIDLVEQNVKQDLVNDLIDKIKQPSSFLRSQYWDNIDFLKQNVQYKGYLWDYAPENIKIELIKKHYQDFFELITQFEKSEYPYSKELTISFKELYNFDNYDLKLIKSWCPTHNGIFNQFELAKMMSARGAEKLVLNFYRSMGYLVEDTSIHQITQQSDIWKKGDIRLNHNLLIDVKNARTTKNSNTYSEFCIPDFKQHRGDDVVITAVLSPYLREELMTNANNVSFPVEDPVILGNLNNTVLFDLQSYFSDRFLSIDISRDSTRNRYLPPWLFDYDDNFYTQQRNILSKFRTIQDSEIPDWKDIVITGVRPFPLFIAAKRNLPDKWQYNISSIWKKDFVNYLINYLPGSRISLPYLFLALLRYFLVQLHREDEGYSPKDYKEIIYTSLSERNPLKIYDPLNIIKDFGDTLQILWENRKIANLDQFTMFKFNGQGLLQGKREHSDRFPTNILAYCGGSIQGKGKCGYRPLILGKHNDCTACGKLICPNENCQFCSKDCRNYAQRKNNSPNFHR